MDRWPNLLSGFLLLCLCTVAPACGDGGGEDGDADGDGAADPQPDGEGTVDPQPDVEPDVPPDADATDPVYDPPVDVEPEVVIECDGNCHYVREGGSGDGSDWENAMPELPDALERGHVYYVAAGSYPGYEFDDPASGEETIIVVKATEADHGTDTGWQSAYGEARTLFGPLSFTAPYHVLDGRPGMGIEVVAGFQGDVVSIDADHVTLMNCDLNGNFTADGSGQHVDGACTGLGLSGTGITVRGCEIHDAADDGVSMSFCWNLDFSSNVVHRLHGCGTDGGCGPCYNGHSDGLELYNVNDSVLDGNFIYDVSSTACIFFGNWADSLGGGPDEYCKNLTLMNNILYSPDTGFAAYLQDAAGLRFYNNVVWGLRDGRYGGLSVGQHITDMDMVNNIILSINTEHVGATYDPANHRSDYNLIGVSLGQFPESSNDIVNPDPGFTVMHDVDGPAVEDPVPADFSLQAGSPCVDSGYPGDAAIAVPGHDFFGNARDGSPDRGAIERID